MTLTVMKQYALRDDATGEDFLLTFDCGDLVIAGANKAVIRIEAGSVEPFMHQLNRFVETERSGKKA